jgi:uncharacterized protein (TIGR02453 family)
MQTKIILHFLKNLKENNNREWFAAHKDNYLIAMNLFEQMSIELVQKIAQFDKQILNVNVKDCIFRIYRDIRFSPDKTPYKTHFGVYIAAQGGRRSELAGYYLHLDPAESFFGAGVWQPQPHVLKALRQSVYDNIDELNEIRNEKKFKTCFPSFFQDDKLKSVPAGFPKDFPDADLLKLKHYLLEYSVNERLLNAPDFIDQVSDLCKTAFPFNKFLNYTIEEMISNKH